MSKRAPETDAFSLDSVVFHDAPAPEDDFAADIQRTLSIDERVVRLFYERNRSAARFSHDFVQTVGIVVHNNGFFGPLLHYDAVFNRGGMQEWMDAFVDRDVSGYMQRGGNFGGVPFAIRSDLANDYRQYYAMLFDNTCNVVYDVHSHHPFLITHINTMAPAWLRGALGLDAPHTVPVRVVITVAPEDPSYMQRVYNILYGCYAIQDIDDDAQVPPEVFSMHEHYINALATLRSDLVLRLIRNTTASGDNTAPLQPPFRTPINTLCWTTNVRSGADLASLLNLDAGVGELMFSILDCRYSAPPPDAHVEMLVERIRRDPARAITAIVRDYATHVLRQDPLPVQLVQSPPPHLLLALERVVRGLPVHGNG